MILALILIVVVLIVVFIALRKPSRRDHEDDNRSFWENWAGFYDRFMSGSEKVYRKTVEQCSKRLTKEMRVLELGCGTGVFSSAIAEKTDSLEATDFSPSMVQEAQKKPHPDNLRFSVMDATKLSYASDSFDAVFIANALHVMPHPEKALAEISRVLKPDGLLICPTYVWSDRWQSKLRMRIMEAGGARFYSHWSEDDLIAFLTDHGFAVIYHEIFGNKDPRECYIEAQKQ